MDNYQYPLLTPEDIVSAVDSYTSLEIPADNLSNPKLLTKDVAVLIYQNVLQHMFSLEGDIFKMLPLQAEIDCSLMDNSIITATNITRCLNFLLKESNICVLLMDVLDPKPKKTKRILSALLNFYMFFETHKEDVENIRKTNQNHLERRELLQQELKKMETQKLAQIQQHEQCFEELTVLEEKIKEQETAFRNVVDNSDVEKKETEEVIQEIERYEEQKKEKQGIIHKLEAENSRLDDEIVQSPNKMKDNIRKLDANIEETKTKLQEITAVQWQLKGKFDLWNGRDIEVKQAVEAAQNLQNSVEIRARLRKEMDKLAQDLELKDITLKEMQQTRSMSALCNQSSLSSIVHSLKQNINVVDEKAKELERTLESLEEELRQKDQETTMGLQRMDFAREKLSQDHEASIDEMQIRVDRLKEKLDRFAQQILKINLQIVEGRKEFSNYLLRVSKDFL